MTKTNVLGRGLENLIPAGKKNVADSESNSLELKIDDIRLNPNQPRKKFNDDSLQTLAQTVKRLGIITPITVKKTENGYQLISGERRLRAAKLAGFVKIPVIIKRYTDSETLEAAIIENIQRENLNPIEEGLAYKTLSEKLNLNVSEIADKIGKSRSAVSNLIRLLNLPESIRELLIQRKISEGHARPLLNISDRRKAESLAEKIIKEGWSVRQVEDYIGKLDGDSSKSKMKASKKDPNIANLESKVRNKLSLKVNINHSNKGKGKLVIHYNSLDDLEKITQTLGIR